MTITTSYTNETIVGKRFAAPHHPWWYRIAQVLTYGLLCVAVLEGYFRMAGVGCQEFVRPNAEMGCEHISGKKVIWRLEGYSDDKLSSVGLRDTEHQIAKEAGAYRVALLGDSAVESLQVGLNQTFGKVLESLLNKKLVETLGAIAETPTELSGEKSRAKHFEVINFGCSSYSTGQEVLRYEQEIDKYNPDAIVLLYNRGDSLENVVHDKDRKHAEARPYFYLDAAGKLQQDNSILIANIDKLKPQTIKDFFREHSAIYGVLTQADLSLTLNEPRYRKIKSWAESICNFPGKIMGRRKNKLLEKSDYPDQNDMAVTSALLERLADNAATKKRTFILMVFPNTVHYDILTEQAKELKALAHNKHFQYLDLSNSFLADSDPSSNFIQYHFSKKGHNVVACQLMNVINQSK